MINKTNFKKWDIFYIHEKDINNYNQIKDNLIQRPCIVLQIIGSNLVAVEITSKENKFHLPLITKISDFKSSFAKLSYIFTINLNKKDLNIKTYNQKINEEDRENISLLISIDNLFGFNSLENWKDFTMSKKINTKTNLIKKGNISEYENKNLEQKNKVIISTKLKNSNFEGAKLQKIKIKSSILKDSNFKKSDLSLGTISSSNFKNSNFENANLSGVIFKSINFENVNFEKSNLEDTVFKSCKLTNTNFKNAKFRNTTFQSSNLKNAEFNSLSFENINFISTNTEKIIKV